MFCPKCGTENPEEGKFCRKCGTDISGVSRVIGNEPHTGFDLMGTGPGDDLSVYGLGISSDTRNSAGGCQTSNDPDDLFAGGIRSAIFGFGFLVISCVLFFTNVAGGNSWWWAMLFPAFAMLASGIGNVAKSRRLENKIRSSGVPGHETVEPGAGTKVLDQARTPFVAPDRTEQYETGDLVPPSVVEETTKHLRRDPEGETMTLPDLDGRE